MNDGGLGVLVILYLAVAILVIAGGWKVFTKAGKPGWGILIPIYNLILWLEIAEKPLWWFLLMLIPLVNIVICIIVFIAVARNFGKGDGFGLGLIFLSFIFIPILGFGDAQYQGNKG